MEVPEPDEVTDVEAGGGGVEAEVRPDRARRGGQQARDLGRDEARVLRQLPHEGRRRQARRAAHAGTVKSLKDVTFSSISGVLNRKFPPARSACRCCVVPGSATKNPYKKFFKLLLILLLLGLEDMVLLKR